MSYMEILGLIVLIALCIYTIVDRICKCMEQCHTIDAFGKYASDNYIVKDGKDDESQKSF